MVKMSTEDHDKMLYLIRLAFERTVGNYDRRQLLYEALLKARAGAVRKIERLCDAVDKENEYDELIDNSFYREWAELYERTGWNVFAANEWDEVQGLLDTRLELAARLAKYAQFVIERCTYLPPGRRTRWVRSFRPSKVRA
jgi:hypothetical protein